VLFGTNKKWASAQPLKESYMQISDQGLQLVKQSEGFRSAVYLDPVGLPTVGYGHLLKQGESFPNGVTEAQATDLLRADVSSAENAVSSLVTVPLTQGQFDALVDFTYNLGAGNLKSSTLLKLLNAGNYQGAADEFPKWNKAGGKVLPGLTIRRQAERSLFLGVTNSATTSA